MPTTRKQKKARKSRGLEMLVRYREHRHYVRGKITLTQEREKVV